MENAIKVKLAKEQLDLLAKDTFGIAVREAEELTDGWANTAYRILLEDGRLTALKVAPLPGTPLMRYEAQLMATEVEAMKLASSVVPVPAIYRHDTSQSLIGSDYYFMEWLDGTPYNKVKTSMKEEERAAVERELGVYSRRINEIEGPCFGAFGHSGRSEAWPAVFRRMAQDVLEDGKDRGLKLPFTYEEAERELDNRMGLLEEIRSPRLVHWDLWDGNVFVRDGKIIGLIDFERAFWGDPRMEFYFGRLGGSAAFRQGYGADEDTIAETGRRKLYDFYLDLILFIECDYRGYQNPGHLKWASDMIARGWKLLLES